MIDNILILLSFLPRLFGNLFGIQVNGTNPIIVINLVAILFFVFLIGYIWPAYRAQGNLKHAKQKLSNIKGNKIAGETITKDDLEDIFRDDFFASARKSFSDTLHEQYNYEGGQKQLLSIRSTVPAEIIFSPQSLVDARLHVEFFKHLPGILTGIGIIGTFYGLINGIQHFNPSLLAEAKTDPKQMVELFAGLETLFKEVQGAFIASFFAIGAAMLITLLEKVLLNFCYRRLETLCQELDELYTGGVGEDYLASLVKSSTENTTQTKQLKESLVTELSGLLRELNDQQIKQSEALGNLLSGKIQEHINANKQHGEQFRTELKNGLADIGKTVANVTGGQGDAMTGMLDQLIRAFADNIQNSFGGQMRGLAELMNTSVASMTEMQRGFTALLQDLRQSGEKEREDLTAKVTALIGTLEAQQGKLERQMSAFVEALQTQIGASQQATMGQVRESLQEIHGSVSKILVAMENERVETLSVERERHREFAETSKRLVSDMGTQVGGLVERSQQVVESMGDKMTAQLNDSLTAVHASINKLLTDMEQERRATAETERELHRQFSDTSKQLVLDMRSHIQKLLEEIGKTITALNQNIIALDNASLSAIKGMNDGALRISSAADHFAEAGTVVSGVMQQAEKASTQLSQSANTLTQATLSLENQLAQYALTRDSLAKMVTEMAGMLDRAKQEAGVSQKIVEDMRRMVESFGVLKDDMDEFVDGISKLLAETMAKFKHDIGTHNTEFHKHHADTLKQVAEAYAPLSVSIAGLTDMVAKIRKN